MKYISMGNLLGTFFHFEDGTLGELDLLEILGFVNIGLKTITIIYSLRAQHVTCWN
jgi:hypothetical protein